MDAGKLHILETNPGKNKFQTKNPHTETREIHHFNQSRKLAESSVTAQADAESKLSAANKTVKDLILRIEESNSRSRDLEKLKMARTREEEWNSGNSQYTQVTRELESVRRDLSKVKLDMASITEEKRRAEKEIDSSMSKVLYYSTSVEVLTKEMEEIDEEHVLVELARIEAIKECREIEAQRREEADKYSTLIEGTRKKMQSIIQEIEDAKEMETKLAITTSEISVLESKLKQVREIEKGLERNDSLRYQIESNFQGENESGSSSLLESRKKELTSVKVDSFRFMDSVDIVRDELKHVMEEAARYRNKEHKADTAIENLNSKLVRATAKLETTSEAADKAKSVVSNLSLKLEQIKSEAETTKKEVYLINQETAHSKAQVQKTETDMNLADERLQYALQELKAVKSSEATALENLKAIVQKTIRNRAAISQRSSTITISKFEYEYLKGHAAEAIEIAYKKVAAAQAWIEALKSSEKEIMIKTNLSERETIEPKDDGSMSARKMVEGDFEKWRQNMKPGRRSKLVYRSASFAVRRRKKEMASLAKFFSGRMADRNL